MADLSVVVDLVMNDDLSASAATATGSMATLTSAIAGTAPEADNLQAYIQALRSALASIQAPKQLEDLEQAFLKAGGALDNLDEYVTRATQPMSVLQEQAKLLRTQLEEFRAPIEIQKLEQQLAALAAGEDPFAKVAAGAARATGPVSMLQEQVQLLRAQLAELRAPQEIEKLETQIARAASEMKVGTEESHGLTLGLRETGISTAELIRYGAQFAGFGVGFSAAQGAINILRGSIRETVGVGIEFNATLEQSTLQFKTLMGNADLAKAHVADLFKLGVETPFTTQQLVEASKSLETFGKGALDTRQNLLLIGDAAAATGANMQEVAFWVGRAYAAMQSGQPFGEATRRLQELAVLTPQATRELDNLEKTGAPASEQFKVLTDSLSRFGGAMKEQMGTLQGLKSTLQDTLGQLMGTAFAPIFEDNKRALSGFIAVLGSPEALSSARYVAASLQDILTVLGGLGSAIAMQVSWMDRLSSATVGTVHPLQMLLEQIVPTLSYFRLLAELTNAAADAQDRLSRSSAARFAVGTVLGPGATGTFQPPPEAEAERIRGAELYAASRVEGYQSANIAAATQAGDVLERSVRNTVDLATRATDAVRGLKDQGVVAGTTISSAIITGLSDFSNTLGLAQERMEGFRVLANDSAKAIKFAYESAAAAEQDYGRVHNVIIESLQTAIQEAQAEDKRRPDISVRMTPDIAIPSIKPEELVSKIESELRQAEPDIRQQLAEFYKTLDTGLDIDAILRRVSASPITQVTDAEKEFQKQAEASIEKTKAWNAELAKVAAIQEAIKRGQQTGDFSVGVDAATRDVNAWQAKLEAVKKQYEENQKAAKNLAEGNAAIARSAVDQPALQTALTSQRDATLQLQTAQEQLKTTELALRDVQRELTESSLELQSANLQVDRSLLPLQEKLIRLQMLKTQGEVRGVTETPALDTQITKIQQQITLLNQQKSLNQVLNEESTENLRTQDIALKQQQLVQQASVDTATAQVAAWKATIEALKPVPAIFTNMIEEFRKFGVITQEQADAILNSRGMKGAIDAVATAANQAQAALDRVAASGQSVAAVASAATAPARPRGDVMGFGIPTEPGAAGISALQTQISDIGPLLNGVTAQTKGLSDALASVWLQGLQATSAVKRLGAEGIEVTFSGGAQMATRFAEGLQHASSFLGAMSDSFGRVRVDLDWFGDEFARVFQDAGSATVTFQMLLNAVDDQLKQLQFNAGQISMQLQINSLVDQFFNLNYTQKELPLQERQAELQIRRIGAHGEEAKALDVKIQKVGDQIRVIELQAQIEGYRNQQADLGLQRQQLMYQIQITQLQQLNAQLQHMLDLQTAINKQAVSTVVREVQIGPNAYAFPLQSQAAMLPHFAGGGRVPGSLGQPSLIVAHGGEEVVPIGNGGDIHVHVSVTGNTFGSGMTDQGVARAIVDTAKAEIISDILQARNRAKNMGTRATNVVTR